MWAFPAAPCCAAANDQLRALVPSAEWPITEQNLVRGLLDLDHAGKIGISCTRLWQLRNRTAQQMKLQHFRQQLLSNVAWAPLDLPSLVAQHFPGKPEHAFWKLVLVLPSGERQSPEGSGDFLANWLQVKFMGDGSVEDTYINAEDDTMEKRMKDDLRLQDLVLEKLISEFTIIKIPDSVTDLCCQTLTQYTEDGVNHEFWRRFSHDQREWLLGGQASQQPDTIIELFDSVLEFLASVVSSGQSCDLSWHATKFAEIGGKRLLPHLYWNTPE
ncbi:80 kDa MCM3-associated protein [Tupaia chinensis]|uniref:80 kDa MCM3-associated protein n=1 Tax=Tupaia chinensis TaxID=246437 RepID=L9L3N8_TUPCH|nr:80 kDa MCM3-associated protein [Tupaia chinensis]